jgi:hypothetical protein
LPDGFDVPRPFAPALIDTVLEVQDAYHGAAEASVQAARELDEIAIAIEAPSKALALARAAALVQTRRRGGQDVYLDDEGRSDLPRSGCRSAIAVPAPGCPALSSGPSGSAAFMTR